MGSAAMDNAGDLAVGYSASDATINPQLRFAGRLAGDAPQTLAQGEAHLYDGTGSQTDTESERWGDYSDLTVDPSDDCTFWYTNEYYSTDAARNWGTRIGDFKFSECTASAPPSSPSVVISKKSDARFVLRGSQIGFTVTLANVGAGQATGISVADNLPSGPGVAWSLGPGSDGGWTVAGSPPSQHLVYDGTALAAGATTHVHVVSATTSSSCGVYANAASFTADSPAGTDRGSLRCRAVRPLVVRGTGLDQLSPSQTAL